ncbi:uncharacterized protein LOC110979411 [Acanthaster planci]|uniref:Uncharacterized protein LOC110979411 n=1 Tax=Acanthaster planci TaxID=133434 RepID=A0A8B7YGV2_ACAPL|nr:uncharacterized protein LOC110979411 [Acanthaster planci]
MPTTPAENRQTGTPEMVLLTDTSKAPSNRAAEMTMSLSPTGRITERYTDSLRLTSDPTTEEIRDGEVTTVTIETTMPAYESSSRPPDDIETLKPNIAEQPDDNGDDKELVDKPEQKKKSKLTWLVPVGVCLVLLGIPAAFVCHYICKKDNSVHALDRLMFKNKGVALPKPKLIKPRYQGATPMTPPKATPVSTPTQPMIGMVEVHKVSGPVDLAESIENNM